MLTFRHKELCPVCNTPQRHYKDGAWKLHQRETDKTYWVSPRLNRDDPPSLRGHGGLDAINIPGYYRRVWEWCPVSESADFTT